MTAKRMKVGYCIGVAAAVLGLAYMASTLPVQAADNGGVVLVSDPIGMPILDNYLFYSRAQGIDTPIAIHPSDLDTFGVILWDETRRPVPPPNNGSVGLSSTVNNQPY